MDDHSDGPGAGDVGRPRLTGKQRAFVDHWFGDARFNGTEAARLAGYSSGNDPDRANDVLAAQAGQTLRNIKVQAEIRRRWARHGMTAEEVLSRLADQARGDATDFLIIDGEGYRLDLAKARGAGRLGLIRKLSETKFGLTVELYDAQAALQLIGRHLGMFKDRVEHTGPDGEGIPIRIIGGVDLDEV